MVKTHLDKFGELSFKKITVTTLKKLHTDKGVKKFARKCQHFRKNTVFKKQSQLHEEIVKLLFL